MMSGGTGRMMYGKIIGVSFVPGIDYHLSPGMGHGRPTEMCIECLKIRCDWLLLRQYKAFRGWSESVHPVDGQISKKENENGTSKGDSKACGRERESGS
jgi:hypothetical protein